MRFTQTQVIQTQQLWASFTTHIAHLRAHKRLLLQTMRHQDAQNNPRHAVSTVPAMVEPATDLMDNIRLQQEVSLHTMRVFLYSICTPWQFGQLVAFMLPYHIDPMELIQFVQGL